VVEQRHRVERAAAWRDLARQDLAHARASLEKELARLDKQVAQHVAELDYAQASLERARRLRDGRTGQVISAEEYGEAEKRCRVCRAQLEQARAEQQARQALGTREADAELARREKELADAQAALALLEAGSRPEEIEAARARLERLREELHYLEGLPDKMQVRSPIAGLITTPHLREKVGQYVREGELIGVVEDPSGLEAEIALAEQEVARVRPGQAVELKARALPFETFRASVDRVAPAAGRGELQSTVTVACRLGDHPADLRPGMTGYARIYTGRRSLGEVLADRTLRYVRTEFWW
jgi:multidrug resistance efflux pump